MFALLILFYVYDAFIFILENLVYCSDGFTFLPIFIFIICNFYFLNCMRSDATKILLACLTFT